MQGHPLYYVVLLHMNLQRTRRFQNDDVDYRDNRLCNASVESGA